MVYYKLLKREINSLLQLSSHGRKLLLQALILFPLVHLSLTLKGLKQTQSLLANFVSKAQITPQKNTEVVCFTEKIVAIASRYSRPWGSCLRRSLVLWFLLRREGVESQLRIGVKREKDQFSAHAWVEWDGVVLNDQSNVGDEFAMFENLRVL
jgi:hypothetical protein